MPLCCYLSYNNANKGDVDNAAPPDPYERESDVNDRVKEEPEEEEDDDDDDDDDDHNDDNVGSRSILWHGAQSPARLKLKLRLRRRKSLPQGFRAVLAVMSIESQTHRQELRARLRLT